MLNAFKDKGKTFSDCNAALTKITPVLLNPSLFKNQITDYIYFLVLSLLIKNQKIHYFCHLKKIPFIHTYPSSPVRACSGIILRTINSSYLQALRLIRFKLQWQKSKPLSRNL